MKGDEVQDMLASAGKVTLKFAGQSQSLWINEDFTNDNIRAAFDIPVSSELEIYDAGGKLLSLDDVVGGDTLSLVVKRGGNRSSRPRTDTIDFSLEENKLDLDYLDAMDSLKIDEEEEGENEESEDWRDNLVDGEEFGFGMVAAVTEVTELEHSPPRRKSEKKATADPDELNQPEMFSNDLDNQLETESYKMEPLNTSEEVARNGTEGNDKVTDLDALDETDDGDGFGLLAELDAELTQFGVEPLTPSWSQENIFNASQQLTGSPLIDENQADDPPHDEDISYVDGGGEDSNYLESTDDYWREDEEDGDGDSDQLGNESQEIIGNIEINESREELLGYQDDEEERDSFPRHVEANFQIPRTVMIAPGQDGLGFTVRRLLVKKLDERGEPVTFPSSEELPSKPATPEKRRESYTRLTFLKFPNKDADTSQHENPDVEWRLFVDQVTEGSSAEETGLRSGDCIVQMDGQDISHLSMIEIRSMLESCSRSVPMCVSSMDLEKVGEDVQTSALSEAGRSTSAKKLSAFFGETVEGEDAMQDSFYREIVKEGELIRKTIINQRGKKNHKRTWKPYYVVLRGHILHFYSSKANMAQTLHHPEGGVISMKSALCDIAHHYQKKKNVMKVSTFGGSEYLLQAPNSTEMIDWIQKIHSVSHAAESEAALDLIKRKASSTFISGKQSASSSTRGSSASLVNTISRKDSKDGTLRNRISASGIMRFGRKKSADATAVPNFFQMGIEEMCNKFHTSVPYLIERLVKHVEEFGLEEEGIYRVAGSHSQVGRLRDAFMKNPLAVNINDPAVCDDIHVVCGLLKSYIRDLVEPVLTSDLYPKFIEVSKKYADADRVEPLLEAINLLPHLHKCTLRAIVHHLKVVAQHCDVNKMEERNLAIVFGPTLVRTSEGNMLALMQDMSHQCTVVELLLRHYDDLFGDIDEDRRSNNPLQLSPVKEDKEVDVFDEDDSFANDLDESYIEVEEAEDIEEVGDLRNDEGGDSQNDEVGDSQNDEVGDPQNDEFADSEVYEERDDNLSAALEVPELNRSVKDEAESQEEFPDVHVNSKPEADEAGSEDLPSVTVSDLNEDSDEVELARKRASRMMEEFDRLALRISSQELPRTGSLKTRYYPTNAGRSPVVPRRNSDVARTIDAGSTTDSPMQPTDVDLVIDPNILTLEENKNGRLGMASPPLSPIPHVEEAYQEEPPIIHDGTEIQTADDIAIRLQPPQSPRSKRRSPLTLYTGKSTPLDDGSSPLLKPKYRTNGKSAADLADLLKNVPGPETII